MNALTKDGHPEAIRIAFCRIKLSCLVSAEEEPV